MMGKNIKVTTDLSGVHAKLDSRNLTRGKYAVANQAIADMNPFVPMKEGILRQTAHVSSDGSQIIYNTPYARKMFYSRAVKFSTPGTGPRWDLKAKSMYGESWAEAFKKGAGL